MSEIKDWLEIANYVTVIGGVIWAILQWPKARDKRDAAERERSYAALNDHFLKFLELQLQAPGLGTSATDRALIWNELSPQEQGKQRVLFDFLASILERAYYFLRQGEIKRSPWDEEQWLDWDHWITRYAQNPNFNAFWRHLDEMNDIASYGSEFVSHIRAKIGLKQRQQGEAAHAS